MFVCCDCCVSGRGLCDELITRLEESYRLWRVVVCDLETSWMRRPCPSGKGGGVAPKTKIVQVTRYAVNIFVAYNSMLVGGTGVFCLLWM